VRSPMEPGLVLEVDHLALPDQLEQLRVRRLQGAGRVEEVERIAKRVALERDQPRGVLGASVDRLRQLEEGPREVPVREEQDAVALRLAPATRPRLDAGREAAVLVPGQAVEGLLQRLVPAPLPVPVPRQLVELRPRDQEPLRVLPPVPQLRLQLAQLA